MQIPISLCGTIQNAGCQLHNVQMYPTHSHGLSASNGYATTTNGYHPQPLPTAALSAIYQPPQPQPVVDEQQRQPIMNQLPPRRSPFYHVEEQVTAFQLLPHRRNTHNMALPDLVLHRLQNPIDGQSYALHMRLYWTEYSQEIRMSECNMTVGINNMNRLTGKTPKKGSKKKDKRLVEIIPPLDITRDAAKLMLFDICFNEAINGTIVLELVRKFSVEDLTNFIVCRSKVRDSVTRNVRRCAVCKTTTALQTCSRCKCVWYCGKTHQSKDWSYHKTMCKEPTVHPMLRSVQVDTGDDEVQCGETRVSLRCPLTICRMDEPARGVNCGHPQCVDLKTFLENSNRTGLWECPVCTKPMHFDDIVVDSNMLKILQSSEDSVDQVRLYPNGTYKPITIDEIRMEDAKTQQVRKKKRKFSEMDDGSAPGPERLPPNLRPTSMRVIEEPPMPFCFDRSLQGVMDMNMGVPVNVGWNATTSTAPTGGGVTIQNAICLDSD